MDRIRNYISALTRLGCAHKRALMIGGGIWAAFCFGILLSALALRPDLPRKIAGKLAGSKPQVVRGDVRPANQYTLQTHLHSLNIAEIDLGNFNVTPVGATIAEFGDEIIHISQNGIISTINLNTKQIRHVDVTVPMNHAHLHNQIFSPKMKFNLSFFRTLGSLVHQTGEGQADLYVSYHRYNEDTQTMCTSVARAPLTLDGGDVRFETGEWEDFFTLNACVNLPQIDWAFYGLESGGRMVLLDDETILLSTGGYELEKHAEFHEKLQTDPDWHLNKILKLDVTTGDAAVYASGLRNPQGLTIGADGRVWEAEHGPRGGDEINLIEEGGNYGWPMVTLGTDYGPADWPYNPDQGRHDGYTLPKYSFVPSVATSGLATLTGTNQFPHWRGDLILTTLGGRSLYRMRVENDSVLYAEQIPIGMDLRDVIELDSGEIAVLTDESKLLLLRNEELMDDDSQKTPLVISGYDRLNEVIDHNQANLVMPDRGKHVFAENCSSCHRIDGKVSVGPPLNGILGAKIGGHPDYEYSQALTAAKGKWTMDKLVAYIEDPEATFPGTHMTKPRVYGTRRLIRFLESVE